MTQPQSLCHHIQAYFNSHPHEEDDYFPYRLSLGSSTFQLTSSRRGWLTQQEFADALNIFQLTSSRRGWQSRGKTSGHGESISTHILTKRMTHFRIPLSFHQSFQLTSSRRGWQQFLEIFKSSTVISTHILTKRMTAILNKNNLFKIAYYINNKHFISIVDIFFHFHIYF